MKFIVTRTSHWGDESPCPEAKPMTVPVWDRRGFKTPEEHDAKWLPGGKWTERGTEHGFWYKPDGSLGGIQRRMEDKQVWYVTIPSLKALMAFHEKYGEIVLTSNLYNDQPTLEIYDTYRE